jgi:alpha-glucosidase
MKNLMKKAVFGLLFTCAALCAYAQKTDEAQSHTVWSPDKAIAVRIDGGERLQYAVTFAGRPVIEKSDIGFSFRDEPDLQKDLQILQALTSSHDETWTPVVKSKHAQIRDNSSKKTAGTYRPYGNAYPSRRMT